MVATPSGAPTRHVRRKAASSANTPASPEMSPRHHAAHRPNRERHFTATRLRTTE